MEAYLEQGMASAGSLGLQLMGPLSPNLGLLVLDTITGAVIEKDMRK